MKKILLLLIMLVIPLICFSFLATTERVSSYEIHLFYDSELENRAFIVQKLMREIENLGYRINVDLFNAAEINSYLISNPGALYISSRALDSELFLLHRIEYLDIMVPVVSPSEGVREVRAGQLESLLSGTPSTDDDILKKVARNRIPVGVISFNNLNLHVRPIPVDGHFPTISSIKSGEYPWVFRVYLHTRNGNSLVESEEFRSVCGGGMEHAFTLIAGGDIMLSRGTERFLELYGSQYPFEKIRDEIYKHDVAFANLESPISSKGTRFQPNKGIYFRADPAFIAGLTFGGFDVLSLGNNHSLDWGVSALEDTMTLLEDSGIAYSGAGETWDEAFRPAVLDVGGVSVALISINDIYPFKVNDATGGSMQTLTYDKHRLAKEIKILREKYDIIIASVHAGVEYIREPEPSKVEMMRSLINCGVDVVLGSHPHVIQDIEVYGEGLIAYSLGNLIFDQGWSRSTSLGLLLEVGFLDTRPVYYYPQVVYIQNAQAHILKNEESRTIVRYITAENRGKAYVKN